MACGYNNKDKQIIRTKGELFDIKNSNGNEYTGEIVDVQLTYHGDQQQTGYIKVNIYDKQGNKIFDGETIHTNESKVLILDASGEKIIIVVCDIIEINTEGEGKYYAILSTATGRLEIPEVDGSDGGMDADGGVDAGGEEDAADGGVEEDGGMDAGDETIADGGDQTENGDQQTCEPRVDCNRTEEGEFTLFTINSEEIKETKASEQCVATAEDCSTSINDSLVFTLSRPLTPEEQQLFMNTHVPSALGVTTQYDTAKRQFGNELFYKQNAKGSELLGNTGIYLVRINLLSGDVISARIAYKNIGYDIAENEPPRQLGTDNIYVKVYPGGNQTDGVPIVVLSDLKLAENNKSININGIGYDVSIEVNEDNPGNLAGMRLTPKQ